MNKKNPIYTTFSKTRFAKDLIFGLVIIYFIINILFVSESDMNFNSLAIGFLLLLFIIMIDSKELVVYENKLRIKNNHLFGIISLKKDFDLSNIKDITYSGKFSQTNDIAQDFLRLILPVFDFKNTLTIKTHDNKIHEYKVHIYKEKLEIVINTIKKSLPNQ